MSDLFNVPDEQLVRPGQTTSAAALAKTKTARANRQKKVYEHMIMRQDNERALGNDHDHIPEEVAAEMRLDLIDVRRCFTVLKRLGFIKATGKQRANLKGHLCEVYKAVPTWAMTVPPRKQKELKPIGDAQLFGNMMRCIYAYANTNPASADLLAASDDVQRATYSWAFNMAERIRKAGGGEPV